MYGFPHLYCRPTVNTFAFNEIERNESLSRISLPTERKHSCNIFLQRERKKNLTLSDDNYIFNGIVLLPFFCLPPFLLQWCCLCWHRHAPDSDPQTISYDYTSVRLLLTIPTIQVQTLNVAIYTGNWAENIILHSLGTLLAWPLLFSWTWDWYCTGPNWS